MIDPEDENRAVGLAAGHVAAPVTHTDGNRGSIFLLELMDGATGRVVMDKCKL